MPERINKNQRTVARTRKMRARNYRIIKGLVFALVAFAMFMFGFFMRGQSAFLSSLGFPESVTGIAHSTVTETNTNKKDVFNSVAQRVAEVEDILATDSLDTYDLDVASEKALNSFGEASNDPYLRYYSSDRYQALLNNQDGSYAGIGVLFAEYNGQAYVVDVFEGSQAQAEGVQEGDFIVSINGDSSQSWSRSEVASVLSQSKGSDVVIKWRRPQAIESQGGTERTTTLVCEEYQEPNVTTEYDEERHVGYIKVRQFTQNAGALVQTAITELAASGAQVFVLDLRDNPGGYLTQAVEVSSLFMNSGTVVEIQTVDGVSAKAATGRTATTSPLVIITNKNTAAAAEVVVAACKESQRATVVGTKTMGKGSVQVMHELSFGGALRYTAAYYLTPEGHAIDQVGVTPTVSLEASAEGDSQKDYAMEVAASMAPAQTEPNAG